MDALVNNKPEFVKLFIDNGANIYEFLTYSRLQRLYCSISQKCLLYELLLKKHEESKLTLAGLTGQQQNEQKEICPLFTLSEVSRVLKDFLHDACKGFYQDLRYGGKKKSVSQLFFLVLLPSNSESVQFSLGLVFRVGQGTDLYGNTNKIYIY